MKHVSASTNEIEEIVSSPKSQANFDNASKDEGSKEPMEKPHLDEVKKHKKKKKKGLMCINIFQP
jgi:hypothetical protein